MWFDDLLASRLCLDQKELWLDRKQQIKKAVGVHALA